MAEEYKALVEQGTWNLVPPPSHGHVIGCQWIFKIKRHSDGTIARYKARLVTNGNQQSEGVDYFETFSPVVKQPTVRVVLSIAVHHNWPLTLFLAAVVQPSSLSLPLGEPPLIRNTYGLSFATIHNPCSRNPFSIRPRSLASFVLPTGLNSLLRRIGRNLTTLFRT
jgi:hypothetical protein